MWLRILFPLAATAGLLGCNTVEQRVAWDHPTASQAQMMRDRYACLQQSMGYQTGGYVTQYGGSMGGAALPNSAMTVNCMALKGYTRNPESGRLVVPPSLVVPSY